MKKYFRDLKGRFTSKPSSTDKQEEKVVLPTEEDDFENHPLVKIYKELDFKDDDTDDQREDKLKKVLKIGKYTICTGIFIITFVYHHYFLLDCMYRLRS